ncbi:Arginine metabolism regulation protein II [Beauveria bassiana]|uniref:Arginine metabolism regulation protein II n=1 Tax=Beauveria bassiana TaxID=176275 RepID=A0A2N6NY05_BEABA|nr:Arginine metabolism regulation protein II [Beauveria bassiana]
MAQMLATSLGRFSVGKALDGLDMEGAESTVPMQPAALAKDRFHGPFDLLEDHHPLMRVRDQLSNLETRHQNQYMHQRPRGLYMGHQHQSLLRYFKSDVVSFSFAARHDARICPWQNIHLPAAEKTCTQLIRQSSTTPTGLSLLYSVLASTCFHLAPRDVASADRWTDLGERYKQEARQHLEVAIQEEILLLTRTNYEELLMALLSTTMLELTCVTLKILCAEYNEAEHLLLEAEYLIRTRGLPASPKSLQLRTLHHVYTHLRVLTESTCGCILRNICPQKPGSRSSLVTEESRHQLRSFRVADQSTESDLRMSVEKSAAAAHDDIHLEVMGDWQDSLFPQLYGLPESLLGLLSQTIRLANEQELLQRDANVDVSMIANLCRRTKVLEHNLLSWKMPSENFHSHNLQNSAESQPATNLGGQIIPRLTTTFRHAVTLFYYRRVQNINGLMLQNVVQKVLESMSLEDGPYEAAQMLWPAFLASCEAIEPPLRVGLGGWLRQMGNKTRIPTFKIVSELAEKVWILREEKQDYTLGWFDVTSLERCPIVAL